jgi:glycerol-3-phosphate acyltransferase PlsY
MIQAFLMVAAYLTGSFPTALIVARRIKGVDIRTIGNGNMGAHNTAEAVGFKWGVIVFLVDLLKGTLPLLLARLLGITFGWMMLIGVCVILGHDFPIFAGLRGGQGTACTAGVFLVLFPSLTAICLITFVLLYAITRSYNISAPVSCGLLLVLLAVTHQPWYYLAYFLALFLFIPVKRAMDKHRVEDTQAEQAHRASHR